MTQKTWNVLVTGGAGYVGSMLVPKLLAAGHKVSVLDLYMYGDDIFADLRGNPNLREVKGDLRDPAFVRKLFKQHGPFEYVYHIAAYAAEGLSHFIRRYNYQTNLLASINVLNEAATASAVCA